MIPTIGRLVHYTLTKQDAEAINQRRVGYLVANGATEGDVYPMLIVRVWGDKPESLVQGQVFIDGNFTHWVSSVGVGEGPRTFAWPTRA